jgi:putative oxidoreductase
MRNRFLFKAGETSAPVTLTALRIGLGTIMIVHGWSKLTDMSKWTSSVRELGLPWPEVSAWFAVAGELLGGIGLLVGLMTPVAAFGVVCVMVAAFFTAHFDKGLLLENGGFEYVLLIALAAVFFMARGAGPYSIDALILRGVTRRRRVEPSTRAEVPA